MAQDWALSFYHSPAWLRNRKTYLNAVIDTDGHVVKPDDDGSFYWVGEYGYKIRANGELIPPRMCERCFSRGKLVPAKVVHHKIWLTPENIDDPHVTLSFENFQRLCQDCHAAVHSGEQESRVTFDENGNVVWKE